MAILFVLLSVTGPTWIISYAWGTASGKWDSLPAPFGNWPLVSVHLLCALPLSWSLANIRVQRQSFSLSLSMGAVLALVTMSLSFLIVPRFESSMPGLDPLARIIIRSVWSFLLVYPWCLMASSLSGTTVPNSAGPLIAIVTSLAIAIVVPAVYAYDVVQKQMTQVQRLWSIGRIAKAKQGIDQIVAIGSDIAIGGKTAVEFQHALSLRLDLLSRQLQTPPRPDASADDQFDYALKLYAMDDMQQAKNMITPLAEQRPDRALMLAGIHDELGDLPSSLQTCQRCLDLLESMDKKDGSMNRLREQAFTGMANYLRKNEQYQQAEHFLKSQLKRWPACQAAVHFELARHYQMGGRPGQSLREYQMAAQLDPDYQSAANEAARQLRASTPVCLQLRPAKVVTR